MATEKAKDPTDGVCVLGVGASAGGLEAFQKLISGFDSSHKLALVLVQHLDPDHESLLGELLGKRATVPLKIIEKHTKVEAGNIYLIPPGSSLEIKDGYLDLKSFEEPRGQRRPIDTFFESLATECGERAAVAILSGTGSDGSMGIRAIKEAGGLVLTQDPSEAKYDGMPKSAIATNAVDMVLPAQELAGVANDYFSRQSGIDKDFVDDAEFVARVAKHMYYRTGHDFSHYKQPTFLRRIARRMAVLNIKSPAEYVQALVSDSDEASKLFYDLLINVTEFFRDKDAFKTLVNKALPDILEDKAHNAEVRIWVPGCSTGEEAYTIAILVAEELERLDAKLKVSIFGTDIDEEALNIAREAKYPNTIAADVPAEYLERYFSTTLEGYRVAHSIRDMVRFSSHSLIKDPPFSKLDLISCRNLIIYFDSWLQERVIPLFHYGLKEGGYLFLGPSENLGNGADLFGVVDQRHKLFRRDDSTSKPLDLPFNARNIHSVPTPRQRDTFYKGGDNDEAEYARIVLSRHAPAFVVIDRNRDVIYSSGPISRYLEIKPGKPSMSLSDIARGDLKTALKRLLNAGIKSGQTLRSRPFSGTVGDEHRELFLSLERIDSKRRMIVFQDRIDLRLEEEHNREAGTGELHDGEYVRDLEEELEHARHTVRATIEELETSNEELKSSNEEMMSMNEELQSANEELSVVNDELQKKVAELNQANDDLTNTIDSLQIGMVFLEDDMTVREFTPEAAEFFRLVEHDRGRQFGDIRGDVDMGALLEICAEVAKTGEPLETELQTEDGESELQIRVLPYRTTDGGNHGLVLTFIPVTELRQYARQLEEAEKLARRQFAEIEELYRVSPQAMALMDHDLRYIRVNKRLAEINGKSLEDHIGKRISDMVPEIAEQVSEPVLRVFETGEPLLSQKVVGQTAAEPGVDKAWEVSWYPIRHDGDVEAVGVNVLDVTRYEVMQSELRRVMQELQHRVKNMLSNVSALINRARNEEGDPKMAMERLVARIQALANTHNLLTLQNWGGAGLLDILQPELTGVYGEDRIVLKGPNVRLGSKATTSLAMALHEMATNAAKYGSLSNSEGMLHVSWARVDDGSGDKLVIEWNETGGPEVKKPEQTGFGSKLIESTVVSSLGGELEREFNGTGFKSVIRLPLENLKDVSGEFDTKSV